MLSKLVLTSVSTLSNLVLTSVSTAWKAKLIFFIVWGTLPLGLLNFRHHHHRHRHRPSQMGIGLSRHHFFDDAHHHHRRSCNHTHEQMDTTELPRRHFL